MVEPWLRATAEKLARNMRYRRRMPAAFGHAPVWVSPAAGLKFLTRRMADIDPVLLGLAAEFVRRGNVVWDIGANLGLFAFASAHLCGSRGRVIAVEPYSTFATLLRRSTRVQPATSGEVVVIQAAVADSLGLRQFCVAGRSGSANFLRGYGSSQAGGVAEEQLMVTVTLDWLAERMPLPDVLKIDIEGAEEEIFSRGTALLTGKRPVLLCEVSANASSAVTAVLRKHDYRIFDGQVNAQDRKELRIAPWNTVALPG